MPHYKDGAPATVGDFVRGTPYNTKDAQGNPREIAGTLISITPGAEQCNCIVAFVEKADDHQTIYGTTPAALATTQQGGNVLVLLKTDYGETKAFEKIG